jgi:Skp family chaperone for outer membrane proteins
LRGRFPRDQSIGTEGEKIVKKIIACVMTAIAAVGLIGVGGWLRGQVTAQQVPQQSQSAISRTRIALINVNKILKDYRKASYLGQSLMKETEVRGMELKSKQAAIAAMQKELQTAATPEIRDAKERDIRNLQRELEDLDAKHRREMTEKQNQMLTTVYGEIQNVIGILVKTYEVDLVFFYPDAPSDAEKNLPVVLMQKLRPAAAFPIYHRGLDFTDTVVATLNAQYPAPETQPAPAGQAVPSGAGPKQ